MEGSKKKAATFPCGCRCGRDLDADRYTLAEFALDVRFWSTLLLFSTEQHGNHPLVTYGDKMSDALLSAAHGISGVETAPPVPDVRAYLEQVIDEANGFRTQLLAREFPPLSRIGL